MPPISNSQARDTENGFSKAVMINAGPIIVNNIRVKSSAVTAWIKSNLLIQKPIIIRRNINVIWPVNPFIDTKINSHPVDLSIEKI